MSVGSSHLGWRAIAVLFKCKLCKNSYGVKKEWLATFATYQGEKLLQVRCKRRACIVWAPKVAEAELTHNAVYGKITVGSIVL